MPRSENRICWLFKALFHFIVAGARIVLHGLRRPRELKELGFMLYSTVNEFHQATHGRLADFRETRTWRDMLAAGEFAAVNHAGMDKRVMRPVEVLVLAALTRHLKPRTVFEIGTYGGFTTLHFAHNMGPEGRIYTLDLPPGAGAAGENARLSYDDRQVMELSRKNIHNRIYRGTPQESKIVELFGDSRTFDYAPYLGQMDLVFIDGNHSRDYVRSDTENAFRMLSPRGAILWHDFDYVIHRDIFKYLNRLSRERKIYAIRDTRLAIYGRDL